MVDFFSAGETIFINNYPYLCDLSVFWNGRKPIKIKDNYCWTILIILFSFAVSCKIENDWKMNHNHNLIHFSLFSLHRKNTK